MSTSSSHRLSKPKGSAIAPLTHNVPLSKSIPMMFRIRPSRIPIYLFIFMGLVTLYVVNSPEDTTRAKGFLDTHLQDWSKYPSLAGGNMRGSSSSSGGGGAYSAGKGEQSLEFGIMDGLARGWQTIKGKRSSHPIEVLIEENKKKWQAKLARQSKTLSQASQEYVNRYKRLPPRGFDEWFAFAKKHDVILIDEFDQINHDIEPFFVLSPELFRQRLKDLSTTDHTFHITVGAGIEPTISGDRSGATRAKQLFSLVTPLNNMLPETITLHVSDHDLGSWILGSDQRELAMSRIHNALKIKGGGKGLNGVKYFSPTEIKRLENRNRNGHPGWFSACPEDSPARGRTRELENRIREMDGLPPLPEPPTPAFVADPRPAFDFCNNPETQQLHGTMSFDFPRETTLRPIFVLSKFSRNNEFLFPPLEAYENATTAEARSKFSPWSEKTENKLFWRGSTTGDSYSKRKNGKYDWRRSHRPRLGLLMNQKLGEKEVFVKRAREWAPEMWAVTKLNEAYMDVGFTGKPHQCNEADGTCAEMAAELAFLDRVPPEKSAKYKYQLDVDGNGWSSRFHRLLMSGSVVVKHTIFPEWHHDWIMPWVHYVPMQLDFSDLYNIMGFFIGSPEGRIKGRDDLAEQIAEQGRKFGANHWRWEDMQAYMYRLLLEYTRLAQDDRDAWSYEDPNLVFPESEVDL